MEVRMSYEEQLSAAKFMAERDIARQDACVAKVKLDRAIKELGEAKRKAGVHGKVISDQNKRIHDLKREVEKLRGDVLRSEIVDQSMDIIEREIKLGVNSIAESLGIRDEIQELPIAEACPRIVAELEKRLMPEGMEWPRYDTGELVLIGDDVTGPDYGERIHVDEITFHANGFTLREKTGLDHWYESDDRFERSAFLAADGVCCEPGTYRCQERAFTCDSCGHTVFVDKCMVDEIRYLRAKGIRTLNCCCGHGGKVEPFIIVNEGDECRMLDMGYERRVNEHGATYFMPKSSCPPKDLTNTKPEPPDTWGLIWTSVTTGTTTLHEFERRCKALAERERGE